jgi:DICT domain-containing protein/GAF domain-containing protein
MTAGDSLLRHMLQTLPDLKTHIYFKATLTALSHAMEDLVLAQGRLPAASRRPLVIASFQQERFYRQEAQRYGRIAQVTDQVYVLAAPETSFTEGSGAKSPRHIALNPDHELAQEWHLVIVGPGYSACLVCQEIQPNLGSVALDIARQFRGFWTFDPLVTRQAASYLLAHIQGDRPDLATLVRQAQKRYRLPELGVAALPAARPQAKSPLQDAQLFADRLVTYLQASQYKQVKAFDRVAEREQQERLVNASLAAIRQVLRPEEVLAVTAQQMAQLVGRDRILLYRLTRQPLASPSPLPAPAVHGLEAEALQPGMPALLGQRWQLASHDLFQERLSQGQLVAIADITQDSGLAAHPDLQERLAQAQIQAALLVPICHQQGWIAVMELHQSRSHLWSRDERRLVESIAPQIGLALAQAESYVNLQRLNQQLTELKQTQNNLVAIVGHELRTPLSTIQVCLESLGSEFDMPWAARRSMVEIALADAGRLNKLIQDFLLLSRLESDLVPWQIEALDLAESIAFALGHLQSSLQLPSPPMVQVELPAQLPLAIADQDALFQILSKLLENACKFTPPTGSIRVSAQVIEQVIQPSTQPAPMLEVLITDTGRGIEPTQLEAIFEQFHQEEGFLQRSVGGVGLGLAICRQLARRLGGWLWATSQGRDQGSEFHLTLPVRVEVPVRVDVRY